MVTCCAYEVLYIFIYTVSSKTRKGGYMKYSHTCDLYILKRSPKEVAHAAITMVECKLVTDMTL